MILAILNNLLWAFLFLSWGSFLNVVGYRLLHGVPFFGARSRCPHCNTVLAWYDLIPVVSWFWLRGRCRTCKQPISFLYPLIELITLASFWPLTTHIPPTFWLGYGLLFSALIVTIRTDLEEMIILRWCTIVILPYAFLFSAMGLLPITLNESLLGAALGFFMLWAVRRFYLLGTGEQGMGDGDPELLATIGGFVGVFGSWVTLLIASFLGSVVGIVILARHGLAARKIKLPFGPFLAVGAMLFILYQGAFTALFTLLP